MMYWLPLRDRTGKRPVSSVYNLLMGSILIWSSLLRGIGGMDGFSILPHTADDGNSGMDGFSLGTPHTAEEGNSGALGVVERTFFLA